MTEYALKRGRWAGSDYLSKDHPWFLALDALRESAKAAGKELVSFANYDYLGIGHDPRIVGAAHLAVDRYGVGAQASRLVGGERTIHRTLEESLAAFLGVDDTLALVSGYLANASLISHLLVAGDLIVVDELSHNSIMAGVRASGAKAMTFRHNDLDHLDSVLAAARSAHRRCLIIVEALYSMDGDIVDLDRLLAIKEKHASWVLLDEAHSIGVLGDSGRGLTEHCGVDPARIEIIMGTLSKTFVTAGGFIAAQRDIIRFLRFTLPGFIYSVGQSPVLTACALGALDILRAEPERVGLLARNSEYFLEGARRRGLNAGTAVGRAVVPILFNDPFVALAASRRLLDCGIYCPPIVQIGVPRDMPRLRFFISAAHRRQDMDRALDLLCDPALVEGEGSRGNDQA